MWRRERVSKVEQYERIRRAKRDDETVSVRELARRFGVHRRDVRRALQSAVPPAKAVPAARELPVLGDEVVWIRAVLVGDRDVHRKQRHTAKRIRERLAAERGVVVSESHCRHVVAALRAELDAELAVLNPRVVTVPQTKVPGGEAEVDWGQFTAVIAGVTVVLHLFAMRLSYSGQTFHRAYAHEASEAFLDAHVRAFDRFGGVPLVVRYDNLKTAVVKVLRGRDRTENDRFVLLRSHYRFDSFFCEPGIAGAHEKGGVEGDIGWFRRSYLVPVPSFDTIAALNVYMAACDLAADARFVIGRGDGAGQSVAVLAEADRAAALTVPVERFETSTRLSAKVDTKARICVRQSFYSVPARLCGQRVIVDLGADTLTVSDNSGVTVGTHDRSVSRRSETLVLDHYLEVLWARPGALGGSTALVQARTTGRFTDTHQQFWDLARRLHGDRDGTKALCDVLLLHRHHNNADMAVGIQAALSVGSADPGVVAVEARRAVEHTAEPVDITGTGAHRATPKLADYDRLLGRGSSNGN